ncbi:MAG: DNA repair protein RadA [Micropepsaceae bacterium]
MARSSSTFVCQSCGAVTSKWAGRCESCGGWNTIVEETAQAAAGPPSRSAGKGRKFDLVSLQTDEPEPPRVLTGVTEFDRVLGGGLVPGSAILVGGDPGIGKSTILLQALAALARHGKKVVYVSGEEAAAQVRLRARRLGLADASVDLAMETSLKDILATLDAARPEACVIDSIQTLWSDAVDSAPGTVSQVRAVAQELVRFAKRRDCAIILVGHVTKDGQIAGPRVVEHLVDTVLYFEGERGHQFRILRAVKNRFGPTDEIGVFEMTDKGLAEVLNPSTLFLTDREQWSSGAAVFAGVEGTRPLLVELQALASPTSYGTPRRAVIGWDTARLSMVLAVLETRCGLGIGGHDIYLNVAGGLKITEPAADLAAAGALISSVLGRPLAPDCVLFGEVALSGAIRPVGQADSRLKEAAKLGFKRAICPPGAKADGIAVTAVSTLGELVERIRNSDV